MTIHYPYRALRLLVFGLILAAGGGCSTPPPGDSDEPSINRLAIVTTEALRSDAEAYRLYRERRGFEVELTTTQEIADDGLGATLEEGVRTWVHRFVDRAPDNRALFVLIIGDAVETTPEDVSYVPVAEGPDRVVGDSPYVDFDDDGIPDLPIGRLPFREGSEVAAYLERVQEYEAVYLPGPWNKRIPTFAGQGGFGEMVDSVLEMVGFDVAEQLSYDFDMTMTYAAPTSAYHLPNAHWHADYATQYNAGSVLQPYIGHTLGTVLLGLLEAPPRRGMVMYLSCGDGSFQYVTPVASLSEEMLLHPAGPLVAFAASTESHPYGNALYARELSHALFNERATTYGDAVVLAKHNIVHRLDDYRSEMDAMASGFLDEPAEDIIATHLVMYNLLGDPALSSGLPPGRVVFDGPAALAGGETVTVSGDVTVGEGAPMVQGEVQVTLESSRSAILGEIADVDPYNPDPDVCEENHRIANDKVVVQATGAVRGGRFTVTLDVPTGLPQVGYYLKAYAENSSADAIGSLKVLVSR